jgi:hypothetical protein
MNSEFVTLICATLSKLRKDVTDSVGDYLHMQVSFSNNSRMYVCLCPLLRDTIIIHSEYDMCSRLDETIVMPKDRFQTYISTFSDPEYIGLREDHEFEDLTTVLKRR